VAVRDFDPVNLAIEIHRELNRGLGEKAEQLDDPL
jgi:hypothetical protein